MIKLNYKQLKNISLFYMILPIFIFFIGWLKWYIAILAILIFGVGFVKILLRHRNENETYNELIITPAVLIITFIISMAWCFLAGQGGFFYQSSDYDIRNAIFRDLINYKWPVIYENNNALVYYIGHWMVPAVIGKLFYHIGGESLAWEAGNIALYIWTTIGIFIIILLIFNLVKAKRVSDYSICLLVLIFFSGLDIIGIIMQCISNHRIILIDHIESWSGFWEYSSMTTGLFWVFNQVVVVWMIVLIFLNETNVNQYAFLGVCLLPYAPIPFIGMLPIFIAKAIQSLIHSIKVKRLKEFWTNVFSLPNITGVLTVFPIYSLYYISNKTVNDSGYGISNGWSERGIFKSLLILGVFMILEFGIYVVLIWEFNRKNIMLYISASILMIIPFFRLGSASDFTMRASVPAITILMVLVIDYILQRRNVLSINNNFKNKIVFKLLILALLIGSITPMFEFGRAGYYVIKEERLNITSDTTKTLSDKNSDAISNFITDDMEQATFYKYLSK